MIYFLIACIVLNVLIPKLWIPGYLTPRWHLIPRSRSKYLPNAYLHRFTGDDDRMLHNHPYRSWSLCLKGRLKETFLDPSDRFTFREGTAERGVSILQEREISPADGIIKRECHLYHRLEVVDGPVWTLFITSPIKTINGDWFFLKKLHYLRDNTLKESAPRGILLRETVAEKIVWHELEDGRPFTRFQYRDLAKWIKDYFKGAF